MTTSECVVGFFFRQGGRQARGGVGAAGPSQKQESEVARVSVSFFFFPGAGLRRGLPFVSPFRQAQGMRRRPPDQPGVRAAPSKHSTHTRAASARIDADGGASFTTPFNPSLSPAPAPASARSMPRPIPWVEPVTRATLPARLIVPLLGVRREKREETGEESEGKKRQPQRDPTP